MDEYNYENFKDYMNHFYTVDPFAKLDARAKTFDIIETMDVIDEAVKSMTECPEAVNMLQHIGIKTE